MSLLARILGFVAFLVAIAGGLLLAGVALVFVAGFLAIVLLLSFIAGLGRRRKPGPDSPAILEGEAVRVPDEGEPEAPRQGIEHTDPISPDEDTGVPPPRNRPR